MPNNPPERPKKLQRISQACDLCHRRSIRCRPSTENAQHQCQNCYDFAVDCTYNRPSRRRRNQSQAQTTLPNLLPSQQPVVPSQPSPVVKSEPALYINDAAFSDSLDYTGAYSNVREGRPDEALTTAWRSFAAASQPLIERCLEMYMEVVYPMFPLFHEPTLWTRLRRKQHLNDRGLFASIMAACALASARARDGATGHKFQFEESMEKASEVFFSAAQDAISKDLSNAMGLGYLRACALLALTSIQYGQITTMHQYMGHYHTLSAMQHFHEEEKWPTGLPIEEKEERRRLFWSMYSWDIYTSVVFNTIPKSQETHSGVRYPSEVNDDELTPGIPSPNNHANWLRGWNFTTDLYRVLEHTMKRLRRNQDRRDDRVSVIRLLISDGISDLQVMENIHNLYYQLPARFKDYRVSVTGERSQDIYGFQAANIQATLQLVKITLFESSNWSDVQQKCDVAEQVLSTFQSVQPHYLRAISTPLVYHLGGIGQILASVMQGTLTEDSYQRVRALLNSMADVLEGLESGLQPAAGASRGLREQIDKIDGFMHAQRQMLTAFSSAHPPTLQGLAEAAVPTTMPQTNGLHPNGILPINSLGMRTPLDEFQLPADVIGEWPWPFDFTTQEGSSQMSNGLHDEQNNHHR